jgi:hypothetical protein
VGPARDRRPDLRQPIEPVAGAARDAPAARDRRPDLGQSDRSVPSAARDRRPDLGQPDRPVAAPTRNRRPDLRQPDRPTGLAPRSRTVGRSALGALRSVSVGPTARGRGSRPRAGGATATATRTVVERPAGAQPAIVRFIHHGGSVDPCPLAALRRRSKPLCPRRSATPSRTRPRLIHRSPLRPAGCRTPIFSLGALALTACRSPGATARPR